ncbi:uncharacterized protein LOC110866517 [Helianthus annuus]|uniref:uncharacterized protein LOC110866517 n=1 Tax=Helianthus annuus TaxID=4232 RepID=UPI000B8FA4C8|nr:uncharacterized protein LOC110866517 [Helianthus annuus]
MNSASNTFWWNNWATGKSIAFVWRELDERIPSAVALRSRVMSLQAVTCKTCGAADETASHILVSCNLAKRVWEEVTKWTKLPMVNTAGSIAELLQVIMDSQRSQKERKVLHAIAIQTMWSLWKTRNAKIFAGRQRTNQMIIEEIKDSSF